MSSDVSIIDLTHQLRAGETAPATRVFQRFAKRLIGLAKTHLDVRLRPKLDPEDVVQSVFRSFFRRVEADLVEINSWDNLWYLLALMTLRKCLKRVEHFHAARRDARREVQLNRTDDESAGSWREMIDREPTPQEAIQLTETIEETLRDFDVGDREVIVLSLQGYSVKEISSQLQRADRSVRRIRERVRHRLQRMLIIE